MLGTKPQRLLAELPATATASIAKRARLKLGKTTYRNESLFTSPSNGHSWNLLSSIKVGEDGRHPWDSAHDACKKFAELTGAPVYVEPDLDQAHPYLNRRGYKRIPASDAASATCEVNAPDDAWPTKPNFAWHLGDDFSQLKTARDQVMQNGGLDAIRICHLDTGFDPRHSTCPVNINRSLARNFVENNNDAADPGRRGILYNPGHGTGTIGILAGGRIVIVDADGKPVFDDYLGGAPMAEIVPVRSANSVVHLFTSSMARSIAYAAELSAVDDKGCHVASISMGGLPSRAWAAAVNKAYDAGVCVVAAAGNNFGGFPIKTLVYPARFKRVIAACGVTADQTPYSKSGLHFHMQGNFGPDEAMSDALAAFTPNIPWAELGCRDTIDLEGAGTSSATPQIASGIALWLATHGANLPANGNRVEAARQALYQSADKSHPKFRKYFGNGILKAHDALSIGVEKLGPLELAAEDDIRFPILNRLAAWGDVEREVSRMYEVEAAQLYMQNARLQEAFPELDSGVLVGASIKDMLCAFIDLPDISLTMRDFFIFALSRES